MYNEYDLSVQRTVLANATGTHSDNVRVNRFAFTAPECPFKTGKARNAFDAERAITDTIKYLGFMSLKNSDHAGDKKDVTQATAQRTAADRLIAAGTVVLLGTWSNGIAVGPGTGFVACTNEPEAVAPVKAKKSRKPVEINPATNRPRHEDSEEEIMRLGALAQKNIVADAVNNYRGPLTCDWAPAPMHGPAFVAKPRVRVPLATMQAPAAVAPAGDPPGLYIDSCTTTKRAIADWHAYCDALSRNDEEPAQPVTEPPTPIYTPAVGDTVQICYQHERMTTDRIVNVQRVAADGKTFRGYDRTYDRVRNYDMARVVTIRRLGGEGVDIAAG